MDKILEQLRIDFIYYTGTKYVGLVKAIGAGFASRLFEFYDKLDFIKKQAFVKTADSDYLYLHTGHLLPPKSAETATGSVVFFGELGATITTAITIKDSKGEFRILSESTIVRDEFTGTVSVAGDVATMGARPDLPTCFGIVNGVSKLLISASTGLTFAAGELVEGEDVTVTVDKSASVSVQANEAGTAGNRAFNDELKTKVTVDGINKGVAVVSITGGADDEDVETYRNRVIKWQSNPQAPFNANGIKDHLLTEITNLKYVWVKGGELEEGQVKIFLLNKNDSLTGAESVLANELVSAAKPAQMRASNIETRLVTLLVTEVVISGLLPSNDELREQVKKNIQSLFEIDLFEQGISVEQLESVIYRSSYNNQFVSEFTIDSGQCAATAYSFWKLGSVTFI